MSIKQRLSASVDADAIEAGQAAVARGEADNLSAWVNDALHLKAEHDRRMQALDEFIAAYEAENGIITQAEIDAASRRLRSRAVVVRGAPKTASRATSRRRSSTAT